MVGACCETEPLRFQQTSFFILRGGFQYLIFHFLIWTYTWNNLQFLEL